MSRDHQFTVGDVVLDTQQESPNPAVVLNLPPKQANEWVAYADTSVAEDNPDYPDDSPIVVVAFYGDLADRAEELLWPESPVPLTELSDYGVKDYAFPVDRLKPADDTALAERHAEADQETTDTTSEAETASDTNEHDDGEGDPETTREDTEDSSVNDDDSEQDLHDLRDYLKDNGVRSEIGDETVAVEKLGETYQLSTDEVVEGDGPYRDRLEQLLNEAPV